MQLHRRRFLSAAAVGVAGIPLIRSFAADEQKAKVRLAVIGVSNRGASNLAGVAGEEIVALCDVVEAHAVKAREQFPKAKFFTDYRKMLDAVGKEIDAVVVSTPDHTHAHASLLAMNMGKHLYCEKPLCRSVDEVRRVATMAEKKKLITQMGTQIHAGDNYRRVVEIIQSGGIGPIKKVHVWCSRRPDPARRLKPMSKADFDIDQWMGPVNEEFFAANHKNWPHFHWRWWWEFGGGVHADMGCHFTDLAHWALGLKTPIKVKATGTTIPNADNGVPETLQVDYTYRTPGGDLQLTWYHGVPGPDITGKTTYKNYRDGVLFEGADGKKLISNYSSYQLFPDEFAKDFKAPPQKIAKSVGHHLEWLNAIRGGPQPLCHFGYSAPLAQSVLLGNVSFRADGVELTWDNVKGTTGNKTADQFLATAPRKGWEYPS